MTSSITPSPNAGLVHHGADRRRADRSAANFHAILRYQDRLHAVQGSICDISVGGAGFVCQQPVTANSKCTLQFDLPALSLLPSQAVKVPVMVINSMQVVGQAHQFRVNLQFVGLPPKVRIHIEGIIRQSLGRS